MSFDDILESGSQQPIDEMRYQLNTGATTTARIVASNAIGEPENSKSEKKNVKYKVGDFVEVHSAKHGWGRAKKGDIMYITTTDSFNRILYGRIQGHTHNFSCSFDDVTYIKKADATKMRRQLLAKQEEFFNHCHYALPISRDDVRQELRKARNMQYEKYNEIECCTKRINELENIAKSMEARIENSAVRDSMRHYCRSLIHFYDRIVIDDNNKSLVGFTKPISFIVKHDMEIEYGSYKVILDYIGQSIRVLPANPKKAIIVEGCYSHPNVQYPSGRICLGTYHSAAMSLLAKKDVAQLFDVMFDFLSNTSDSGAYRQHGYWAVDVDKRCTHCWKLQEKCTCKSTETLPNNCAHCGRPFEDCNCIICPRTHEPLDNNNFPDDFCTGAGGSICYATDPMNPKHHFCTRNTTLQWTEE